ncbi:agmatine deiminase family protein [Allokutzneria sp. A3M-2-11 16]|uniref:agmatine deiminase family protein n=1 Tax=Allokutzneria sp. A3M-2-11 16 TaxID=2962043 RepID=UPI0020B84DA8|nr:agmatine deiminase family protein [Allokutzneria sp. A3M-2-11 16]MCP3803857.1 agmatine deiminase family protein [Allokutzneria sp. A3M-2-11 16]
MLTEEGQPHKRTWMAFGPSERVWGARLLPRVREDLARIATTIARGRPLRVETLDGPEVLRANDPEFGDPKTDPATRATLERLFPGREVVQINIDALAAGGGGIHCTTQQEPVD